VAQGAYATFNLVKMLPKLAAEGVNVKAIAAVSEELFDRQPQGYRDAVLPAGARQDLMFVTGGTRRMWPLRNVGAQADEYSLTADWDDKWLTGGLEADVIAEAHLDAGSVFNAVRRFAYDRPSRLARQRQELESLS
jgi:transketolase